MTCFKINSALDLINMIIFTKTSFFTHVLYHPHISAIYKMLNPIIKITSELAHVSVRGKRQLTLGKLPGAGGRSRARQGRGALLGST